MGIIANGASHINTHIDTGFNPIADYSPELASSGIGIGYPYILLIQSEIGNLGAGAKVAPLANNAVTNIIMVGYFTSFQNYGVLDLHGIADVTVITDRSIRANIAAFAINEVGLSIFS